MSPLVVWLSLFVSPRSPHEPSFLLTPRRSFCDMIKKQINSVPVYLFENISKYKEVGHFVSTRIGGFSKPPYNTLNLGFHVHDNPAKVLKNRRLLATALDVPLNHFTVAKQVHQSNVKVITEELRGQGATSHHTAISATDAMITNVPNIYLMVFLADCVPILFFDPKKDAIGVAHAGWKGTLKFIAQKSVKALQRNFGSQPADIIAGIGPSIGPWCYEVGPEVITQVKNVFQTTGDFLELKHEDRKTTNSKGYFNLWEANKRQLIQAGILDGNIEVAGICTCCNADIFFSARHQKGKTGRFGAGIILHRITRI